MMRDSSSLREIEVRFARLYFEPTRPTKLALFNMLVIEAERIGLKPGSLTRFHRLIDSLASNQIDQGRSRASVRAKLSQEDLDSLLARSRSRPSDDTAEA